MLMLLLALEQSVEDVNLRVLLLIEADDTGQWQVLLEPDCIPMHADIDMKVP